jgi:hypothetical protein
MQKIEDLDKFQKVKDAFDADAALLGPAKISDDVHTSMKKIQDLINMTITTIQDNEKTGNINNITNKSELERLLKKYEPGGEYALLNKDDPDIVNKIKGQLKDQENTTKADELRNRPPSADNAKFVFENSSEDTYNLMFDEIVREKFNIIDKKDPPVDFKAFQITNNISK